MRREQRELGEAHGAVMEGRDIATVVFADAPVKLYLQAPADVRARRRAAERAAGGRGVEEALRGRDARDAQTNPHRPAPDAVVVDTGELDAGATLDAALEAVRELAPELLP
jgi:cytidylate kinase